MSASLEVHPALISLLGSETRARLLSALFMEPRGYHLRGLAAAAGVDSGNALKTLRALVDAGIVAQMPDARGPVYQVNKASPLTEPLRELFMRAGGLLQDLQKVADGMAAEQVHVFGSYARGTSRPDSDVDVLVIGDVSAIEAQAAFARVGRKHHKKIDVLAMSRQQLAEAAAEGSAFLQELRSNRLVTLKGGTLDAAIGQATTA
ncbi:MAG TPA: nucleotidyltransferase domain-containing protein [Ramlibacter sp.]|nr:nucleotidyltransferase domain-containing protein [Ramlibacter sp.]